MPEKIVCFRPGVVSRHSAFECMTMLYRYLQKNFGYRFTIVKSQDENFADPDFDIVSIQSSLWKPLMDTHVPLPLSSSRKLTDIFSGAHRILTVDPTIYPQGLIAIRHGVKFKVPVFFDTSLTTMMPYKSIYWKCAKRFIRGYLHKTTGIIATVPKCMERFSDMGLFDKTVAPKFNVMGHPVNTRVFKPANARSESDGIIRVLTVARLLPEKGLYYILEAMEPLLKNSENIRLQFLGEGPMKPLLQKEIRMRNLVEKIEFLNPVDHIELAEILKAADIFINHAVSLSKWEEYFGAVNIEAMACGLPCILTKSGGIPYVLREADVAVFVEERNIIELHAEIEKMVHSKKLRRTIGQNAANYADKYYSLPVIAEKFHNMLSQNNSLS